MVINVTLESGVRLNEKLNSDVYLAGGNKLTTVKIGTYGKCSKPEIAEGGILPAETEEPLAK